MVAEAGPLVEGAVEVQRGGDPRQLGRVVGVRDVQRLPVERPEARDAVVADGDADLPDRVEVEELGVDLLLLGVDGVEGDAVGVEEGEHLVPALDEDRVEVLGGVDAVDERDELLLEFEPLLQDLDVVYAAPNPPPRTQSRPV